MICPLGRAHEQMETYVRLARSGGTIVLEDPDWDSWHFNPPAPALERLIALIEAAFLAGGGDWKAGRNHLHLLREFGIQGNVRAEVVALSPETLTCACLCNSPGRWRSGCCPRSAPTSSMSFVLRPRPNSKSPASGAHFAFLQCWGAR